MGPAVAAALLAALGLRAVVLVDLATYLLAIATLLPFAIPRPVPGPGRARLTLLRDVISVVGYVMARPGLRGLFLFLVVINISAGFYLALFTPLVLSFASTPLVSAVGGVASLLRSLLMTVWGRPRDRVYGVLGFAMVSGLGLVLLGAAARASGRRGRGLLLPLGAALVMASNATMWQSKVPSHVPGGASWP